MNDGDNVLPPAVTMKSRARSMIFSAPPCHRPTSPERNQRALGIDTHARLGRDFVAPVAIEHVAAAHQDLAVVGELHGPAGRHRADVAWPRERTRWPLMMAPAVSVWP